MLDGGERLRVLIGRVIDQLGDLSVSGMYRVIYYLFIMFYDGDFLDLGMSSFVKEQSSKGFDNDFVGELRMILLESFFFGVDISNED